MITLECFASSVLQPTRRTVPGARQREELPKAASAFFRRICLTKAGGETAADPEVEEQVQETRAHVEAGSTVSAVSVGRAGGRSGSVGRSGARSAPALSCTGPTCI